MHSHLLSTTEQARQFMRAGNATVTLVSKATGARFTYKIQAPAARTDDRAPSPLRDLNSDMRFVKVLTGPDNESSYQYLGFIRRDVFFHGGQKTRIGHDAPSHKAFAWTWKMLVQDVLPETLEIWHEGRCGRCGRKLTVPSSIASGIGPDCAEQMGFRAEEAA